MCIWWHLNPDDGDEALALEDAIADACEDPSALAAKKWTGMRSAPDCQT